MARMMFENLGAIVSNTLTDSIQMIDIDELHESEDNFFEVNRIEEFADTILGQGGVKDNLLVRPLETGGYEIISGHRRRAAVQHLLDRGENISRYLPCLVQNYDDEDAKMLDIVLMNISARQISDAEVWRSYEIIDRILKEKKIAGERFGRVRETLAELLGVSPAQIGKMQNVGKNAIPAVIEAVESGEISISTANEIAKMDEETQEQLVQQSDLGSISPKDLKRMQNEKVDTNINFPKTDHAEDTKVDTSSNFLGTDRTQDTEVDTSSNFSETDRAEDAEVDTSINFSETDRAEDAEVDTSSNFPETDRAEDAEVDTSSNFPETDRAEDIEVDTSSNFPETDRAEDVEVDTSSNFPETDRAEDTEVDTSSNLAAFIHENYYELESIFEAYIGLTDDEEEAELLQAFLPLLHEVKEDVRNKVRFGL